MQSSYRTRNPHGVSLPSTPPDEPDFTEEETDAAAAISVDVENILNLHVPCLDRWGDGAEIKALLTRVKEIADEFLEDAGR